MAAPTLCARPSEALMADLNELLEQTSRTCALAVPLLPEPTTEHVTIAFLLFRIADTFEDAERWPVEKRRAALANFCQLLGSPFLPNVRALSRRWVDERPSEHHGYLALLAGAPAVFDALWSLSPRAREIIASYSRRTAEGMAKIVSRSGPERLELQSVEELRTYCYTVAGIVGELLTELFLLDRPRLGGVSGYLRARAVAFGEGLQLVNILKDSENDRRAGRRYLPGSASRIDVMSLARADLRCAEEYVRALQRAGAEGGLVAFTAMPVLLAHASLARIEEAGPDAKVSRAEVAAIYGTLMERLAARRDPFQDEAASPQPPA